MSIDEKDWDLLSAYHDGALDRREAIELGRRLRSEPALAASLSDMHAMSGALKGLRPELQKPVRTHGGLRSRSAPYLLAASIAFGAVGVGSLWMNRAATPVGPADWHATFLERSYATDRPRKATRAGAFAFSGIPDLSATNLVLVDVADAGASGIALHYSGPNGCRVTLSAFPASLATASLPADSLAHRWSVGASDYVLLATGMDPARFAAISVFVEELTRQGRERERTVIAMRDATENAVPCA